MGYVRTAGMSTAARRRRRRTALVLTGLVTLLLGVFLYAAAYYSGWLPGVDPGADGTTVTATATPTLERADVIVNVYNATERSGLAGRTAEALRARGWAVEGVGNDPERETVDTADIRYGPEGEPGARLLQSEIPGSRLVPDGRGTDKVDLVLGNSFEELPAPDTATATATPTGG